MNGLNEIDGKGERGRKREREVWREMVKREGRGRERWREVEIQSD